MRLGIGIDTGGTYTDAVLYDFHNRSILGSAKALTTRHDLAVGIIEALDGLPDLMRQAQLISLSTTLATNACVENRSGRAKLVFFGGDRRILDKHGSEYGLPPSTEIHLQDSFTTYAGEFERDIDWDFFTRSMRNEIDEVDGIGVIETYAMKNGAVVEKKAKQILTSMTDAPVVCGHELSNELSSLQRGAGALLNAGLFSIIKEFIAAIKTAIRERHLNAPIVIVRSDGSLMSEDFATIRPVETLLCGPAASVIGSTVLTDSKNCVILDMGGTTTDIAVMNKGVPVRAEDGIRIGKWKTFVNGLRINTIGLGGDSAIHYAENALVLETNRVVPLCVAASQWPGVLPQLQAEMDEYPVHTRFIHEFFLLGRAMKDPARYDKVERMFCDALADGPLIRRKAAEAIGKDEYNLDAFVARLVREGTVQIAGLTPTDIMHLTGDYSRYPAEASRLAARFVAANLGIDIPELSRRVYSEVKKKLYVNVVKTLLENENSMYRKNGVDAGSEKLISDSFYAAQDSLNGTGSAFISTRFVTDFALVGIGAPIAVFLPDVAKLLGTEAIIPPHHHVANAVGAIVGKIQARAEIAIRPVYTAAGITGYTVFASDNQREFEELEDAERFALAEAEIAARREAQKRGATGDVTVTVELETQGAKAKDSLLYLGTTAVGYAVGSVAL